MSAPAEVKPGQITEVRPGMIFSWADPTGARRTMLVQSFTTLGLCRRATGINPKTGKRLQVPVSVLLKGERDARLESVIENYVYQPRPR